MKQQVDAIDSALNEYMMRCVQIITNTEHTRTRDKTHLIIQVTSGFYIVSLCSLIFFSFVSPSSTVSYVSAYTHIYDFRRADWH